MRLARLLALLVAVWPSTAAAQQAPRTSAPAQFPPAPYIGKPVVEITFLTEGRVTTEPALSGLVETRIGQPLSMAQVRESLSHLFSLGRFDDVQVDATDVAGGVKLTYNLVPLHNVSRVEFRGELGLSEGELRQAVTSRFGTAPPIGRAADVAATIEGLYRDNGYLEPTVKWTPRVEHDPDRTVLTFDVSAGSRARIGQVVIVGDPGVGRASFLRQVNGAPTDPYSPIEIRRGIENYVKTMRQKGRYEATATYSVRKAQPGIVDLTFDVQTGPAVTVKFEGDPLPADKIASLVPVEREGSVDEDLLEDSARAITDYLKQQGYWKASVETPERRASDGTLAIVFTVHKGPQYRVDSGGVRVSGNTTVPTERMRPLFTKLEPGDLYLGANLATAVKGITEIYQTQGFAAVKVDFAENEVGTPAAGQGVIQPVITIVEGPRMTIGEITFEGNTSLPSAELSDAAGLHPGTPFYEPRVADARDALELQYLNLGYAAATVEVRRGASIDPSRVNLVFDIVEGPQTIVDHIIITGNTRTDPRIIRDELLFHEGGPLGLEAVVASQQRLGALGLFKRYRITELPHTDASRRDVLVTVEEAAPTTLSYGGGVEASKRLRATGPNGEAEEHLEFAPRGFFDIGRRNIGGKNRSVELYARVSLRPRDAPNDPAKDGKGFGFSEYRVVGTYREPRAIGERSDLTVTAAIEQGVRSSFNFARKGINADIARPLAPGIRATLRYSFSTTRIFDERLSEADQAAIDRIFPQVRVSGFAAAVTRDTRDDVLAPSRGTFVAVEGNLAARALGGEVGYVKSYVQGFWFKQIPQLRRAVFATRVAIGLANGFPREVEVTDADGNKTIQTVDDLPASERFFAGGDTTIRGFALDTVGAQNTISASGFPVGGNAVLIMNGELRVPLLKSLGAAAFVDGGNVFARVNEFDMGALRGSVGFGLRYGSPIGPIRVDVGFKLDRRYIGGKLESPRALHFSIGQAF